MSKRLAFGSAALAAIFMLQSNSIAADYDFASFGQDPPAGDGEQGVEGVVFDTSGIVVGPTTELTITTTAFLLTGSGDVDAYLDGPTGGNLAGLGVCGDTTTNAPFCVPGSDDNITADEVLKLSFSEVAVLSELEFRNAGHFDDFVFPDGTIAEFGIAVDTNPTGVGDFTTFAITSNPFVFPMPLVGTDFYIISDATINGSTGAESQLYVNVVTGARVPEPTTALLMVFGLVAFAARPARTR